MSNQYFFKVPCGKETDSYVSNIRSFATTGGTQLGRGSPKACWDLCSNSTCSGVTISGIVWKNGTSTTPGTCGCVNVMKMHLWTINNSTSSDQDAYQFYEPGLNNNFCNGSMPMQIFPKPSTVELFWRLQFLCCITHVTFSIF